MICFMSTKTLQNKNVATAVPTVNKVKYIPLPSSAAPRPRLLPQSRSPPHCVEPSVPLADLGTLPAPARALTLPEAASDSSPGRAGLLPAR